MHNRESGVDQSLVVLGIDVVKKDIERRHYWSGIELSLTTLSRDYRAALVCETNNGKSGSLLRQSVLLSYRNPVESHLPAGRRIR